VFDSFVVVGVGIVYDCFVVVAVGDVTIGDDIVVVVMVELPVVVGGEGVTGI